MPKTAPLDCDAKQRLAVIHRVKEVTGNVTVSCRCFGISRQAYYIWNLRYQAEGVEGLRTRSTAPKHIPHASHAEVIEKIIEEVEPGKEKAHHRCGGLGRGWCPCAPRAGSAPRHHRQWRSRAAAVSALHRAGRGKDGSSPCRTADIHASLSTTSLRAPLKQGMPGP